MLSSYRFILKYTVAHRDDLLHFEGRMLRVRFENTDSAPVGWLVKVNLCQLRQKFESGSNERLGLSVTWAVASGALTWHFVRIRLRGLGVPSSVSSLTALTPKQEMRSPRRPPSVVVTVRWCPVRYRCFFG